MTKTASLLCAILTLAASSLTLSAEDDQVKAARELLETMNFEKTMEASIEASLDAQMGEFAQMGLPPEGITELKKEMLSFFTEVMTYEEMEPEMIKIYTESFTADEMREMTKFYLTPVGKKSVQLIPKLTTQGMALGQQMVQERSRELQQRIIPVFQKHMPKEPAQPAPAVPVE